MYPCHPHFADGTLVVRASHWETQTDRLRVNHLHCSRAWESSYGSDSTDLRHRGLLKPWLLLVTISSRWFFKLGASNTVTPGGRAFRPSLKTVTDEACPLQQWSASLVAKALALQTKGAHPTGVTTCWVCSDAPDPCLLAPGPMNELQVPLAALWVRLAAALLHQNRHDHSAQAYSFTSINATLPLEQIGSGYQLDHDGLWGSCHA